MTIIEERPASRVQGPGGANDTPDTADEPGVTDESGATDESELPGETLVEVGEPGVTDEELTAQALAADPDAPLPADAVPLGRLDDGFPALLPSWYMPAPVGSPSARTRRHKTAAIAVSLGLAAINCAGFCITYGHLVLA